MREKQAEEKVDLCYIPIDQQIAAGLTKVLRNVSFCHLLGLESLSSSK